MTPITINLLTEEHRAQHASARDPVKIAVGVGIVLVALVLAAGAWVQMKADRKTAELNQLGDEQQKMKATQSKGGTGFAAVKAWTENLLAINQSRLLFGPELAMVKDLIPDGIRLTTFRFSVVKETAQPNPAPPVDNPKEKPSIRRAAPKSAEYLVLQLEGRAFGSQPELMVDSFIKELQDSALFAAKVRQVNLRSIARATMATDSGPSAVGNSAEFVIECQYQNRP